MSDRLVVEGFKHRPISPTYHITIEVLILFGMYLLWSSLPFLDLFGVESWWSLYCHLGWLLSWPVEVIALVPSSILIGLWIWGILPEVMRVLFMSAYFMRSLILVCWGWWTIKEFLMILAVAPIWVICLCWVSIGFLWIITTFWKSV